MVTTDTSVADVQRSRAARGIGTQQAKRPGADRPSPPRRRRPALAALAVLLIVGGAAGAGLLAMRLDSRQPVLVLAKDVPPGTEITGDVLTTTTVASDKLQIVPESQASSVIGTYSLVPLKQGQLLETSTLTRNEPLGADRVEVGVNVEPGKAPSDLRSGDAVRLVRIGDGNAPPRPIATGLVKENSATSGKGGLSGSEGEQASGQLTIILSTGAADYAIDAAANSRLGIALLERGVAIGDADFAVFGGQQ